MSSAQGALEPKPDAGGCDTPDIVSSCDSGEGSKRNSLELDTDSLGILRFIHPFIYYCIFSLMNMLYEPYQKYQ